MFATRNSRDFLSRESKIEIEAVVVVSSAEGMTRHSCQGSEEMYFTRRPLLVFVEEKDPLHHPIHPTLIMKPHQSIA